MKSKGDRGFIGTIFLVIVGLAALKYFLNWDIFDAAKSEEGRSTIGYIRDIINTIWSYIETPATFAWNNIVWPLLSLFWQSLQAFLEWGRANATQGIQ
jgi:hypothetical protein